MYALLLSLPLAGNLLAPDARASREASYDLDASGEILFAAAGAVTLGGAYLLSRTVSPLTETEQAGLDARLLPGIDRSAASRWSPGAARWSDGLVWGLGLSPLTLLASQPGRQEPEEILVIGAETMLLTTGLVQLTKAIVRRTRPYAYNPDPRIPQAARDALTTRRSFPSGHTARAFASAVMLASMYARLHPGDDARGWVWAGSLSAAATVGWLRYQSGSHFPTDILAGAALGAALGYAVPRLHEPDVSDQAAAGSTPSNRPGAGQIRFGISLRF